MILGYNENFEGHIDMQEILVQGTSLIFAWLILSALFEESFSMLFSWKIYRENLAGMGFKTPIMFIVSLVFCYVYSIDLLYETLKIFQLSENPEKGHMGKIITAAFLIGGSGTVFRLLEKIRKAKEKVTE